MRGAREKSHPAADLESVLWQVGLCCTEQSAANVSITRLLLDCASDVDS